jgi:hypothetical protein
MSLITLFTKTAPTIGGVEFDAVLEDTLEAPVTFTDYPIESGARAVDHGIIEPYRYTMLVAVSDNPLRPLFTDFAGGILSNFFDSNILSQIAGISAGLLSGSNSTRGASALEFLLGLRVSRASFDLDAGDIILKNMVVTNVRRTKTPENEQGLFAEISLQELPTLDTIFTPQAPKQSQLRDGDPSKSQVATALDKGEVAIREAGQSINNTIDGWFQ